MNRHTAPSPIAPAARAARGGVWLVAAVVALATCARNPVTGQRELSLISESQEIQMGLQYGKEAAASMGVVPDSALQAYVTRLGMPMARASERPNLPWTFTVVEDPIVNAFALPGGPIFITRGILAHMNSEAQLVSVLGHEIGHITAKHSVAQMSRAQLAQIGMVATVLVKPEFATGVDIAGAGLGVLFLKYGRDDETQADQLGFKYMVNAGYDPTEMREMFRTLGRLSGGGGGRTPEWLSTHPDPGNRVRRTEERIAAAALPTNLRVERESFLRRLDGLVFGENPRLGFFRKATFLHPDMKFQFDFPSGWKTQNQTSQVVGISAQDDAIVVLTLAGTGAPAAALQEFLNRQGMQSRGTSQAAVNTLPAATASFTYTTQEQALAGWVSFIALDGATFRLLSYTTAAKFTSYDAALRAAVTSFRRLTDATALAVQPERVRLVRINRAMTIEEFSRAHPSSASVAQLALMNGVDAGTTIPAGTLLKRVGN